MESIDDLMGITGRYGGSGGWKQLGALGKLPGKLAKYLKYADKYGGYFIGTEEIPGMKQEPSIIYMGGGTRAIDTVHWGDWYKWKWHESAKHGDTLPVFNDPFYK